MARKRKTKRSAEDERGQSLEQLLQTADPESYGRVCWYLANHDTQRHRADDVISMGYAGCKMQIARPKIPVDPAKHREHRPVPGHENP